jgi:hypothetical protein
VARIQPPTISECANTLATAAAESGIGRMYEIFHRRIIVLQ